ncbi:MAG TPA: ribose 5-phosphate isomerase B [Syntrophomonadaceae bacterium]|nr:ribose 5-phosphate isomerase B [Syntrophomonadaceae bacterium]HQE22336.1 ribose 5-phosphate isomerase B [Syntrophomonadaceae bacterium]
MKIAIGCDHAGYDLKQEIINHLQNDGHTVVDCGTYSRDSVDYPDIAANVCSLVLEEDIPGILICGTGIGISIAANKVKGIRAALCNDCYTARLAREHNNANIVALGSRVIGPGLAVEVVKTFISTPFAAGRHQRRVEKICQLENAGLREE